MEKEFGSVRSRLRICGCPLVWGFKARNLVAAKPLPVRWGKGNGDRRSQDSTDALCQMVLLPQDDPALPMLTPLLNNSRVALARTGQWPVSYRAH
jgi:hypothetical protein